MAAVGEHGELDAGRAPVLEQRVDRGADRAAGVEDVVDEDHGRALELEVELRSRDDRLRAGGAAVADVDVVAVEGDVELAELELDAAALVDRAPRGAAASGTPRVWMPTSATASSSSLRSMISCAIRESVRRDRLRVEQRLLGRRPAGDVRAHSAPFRPRWTGLKGRRRL